MITKEQLRDVPGMTVYDDGHNRIGKIGQIYFDDRTGQPEWMTVRTGLFGSKETFVPLRPAEIRDGEVTVPFHREQIKEAPAIDTEAGGHLSEAEEDRLFGYYGLGAVGETAVVGQRPTPAQSKLEQPGGLEPEQHGGLEAKPSSLGEPQVGGEAAPVVAAPQQPAGEAPTDEAMTRAEEHLRVRTQNEETGRARLHKYVVTENEQQTVPLRREKAHVEHEPITEVNRDRAMAGPDISESDYEIVLHEERPVVGTETVPVERVRLETEDVTENETVSGQVRQERIQAELPDEERRG